jgi:photosystem II oxygen-evolving enhancer protein 2
MPNLSALKYLVILTFVILSLGLQGCVGSTGGLRSYVSVTDQYQFLYPNGWTEVKVTNGPDLVLHDIIETTENASVIISPVPGGKSLGEIGTPSEVGYRLQMKAIAPENSNFQAELVNAESQEVGGQIYYFLEYAVQMGSDRYRHNLASVTVSRGRLYTFNVSTTEARWQKAKPMLEAVVKSFRTT